MIETMLLMCAYLTETGNLWEDSNNVAVKAETDWRHNWGANSKRHGLLSELTAHDFVERSTPIAMLVIFDVSAFPSGTYLTSTPNIA